MMTNSNVSTVASSSSVAAAASASSSSNVANGSGATTSNTTNNASSPTQSTSNILPSTGNANMASLSERQMKSKQFYFDKFSILGHF